VNSRAGGQEQGFHGGGRFRVIEHNVRAQALAAVIGRHGIGVHSGPDPGGQFSRADIGGQNIQQVPHALFPAKHQSFRLQRGIDL